MVDGPIDYDEWLRKYSEIWQYYPADVDWPRVLLWDLRHRMSGELLGRAIHDLWITINDGLVQLPGVTFPDPDNDQKLTRLRPDEWRVLFAEAGYLSVENDELADRGVCELPRTLYRYSERMSRLGWAWTTTYEDAVQYRVDYKPEIRDGCVWKVDNVDPSRLLAHYHDRGRTIAGLPAYEDEYVYDPHDSEVLVGPDSCDIET